jgi:hypothetical protein
VDVFASFSSFGLGFVVIVVVLKISMMFVVVVVVVVVVVLVNQLNFLCGGVCCFSFLFAAVVVVWKVGVVRVSTLHCHSETKVGVNDPIVLQCKFPETEEGDVCALICTSNSSGCRNLRRLLEKDATDQLRDDTQKVARK